MRAWPHIKISPIRSVCKREIFRRLTRPLLLVIAPCLSSAARTCEVKAIASCGQNSPELETSTTFTKIETQSRQKSIAAFLSRFRLLLFLSSTLPRKDSWLTHVLYFWNHDLQRRPRRHLYSQLGSTYFD